MSTAKRRRLLGKKRSISEIDNDCQQQPVALSNFSSNFNFVPSLRSTSDQNASAVIPWSQSWTAILNKAKTRSRSSPRKPLSSSLQRFRPQQQTADNVHHQQDDDLSTYIRHQAISLTLLTYIQAAFNTVLLCIILYVLVVAVMALRDEFRNAVEEHSNAILDEITKCGKNYMLNRCDPETRVPALERSCNYWAACMRRDPAKVARVKVSAEAIAHIMNSFFGTLSWKSLFFMSTFTLGSIFISNLAFAMFRKRHALNTPS